MIDPGTARRVVTALAQTHPGAIPDSMTELDATPGVFSRVVRATFDDRASAVVKLAIDGPNGDGARRSGAYRREALAYRELLVGRVGVGHPHCHGVVDDPLGPTLVLADLGDHRFVDQLDGLELDDALTVVDALAALHRTPPPDAAVGAECGLHRDVVGGLDADVLQSGLATLETRWADTVSPPQRRALAALVERRDRLAERLAASGPARLCHGDPRADNLAFAAGPTADAVLFDWQQVVVRPAGIDLAWLAATSLTPGVRRSFDTDGRQRHRDDADRPMAFEAYRAGFALPGLAVLFLAQRAATTSRTEALIATSLQRIATAIVELDVASP